MAAFKNILVPIDFSTNTGLAVKRAMDIIDPEGSTIHLLHVSKISATVSMVVDPERFAWLKNIKEDIEKFVPGVAVFIDLVQGPSVEKTIIHKAKEIRPELIIIAKSGDRRLLRFGNRLSMAKITRMSHAAVLTLRPGSEDKNIKSIVVPFRFGIPKGKLRMLIPLLLKKRTTIFLVAMQKELKDFELGDSSVSHTLVETYRLLKEEVNCQVVHKLIGGRNIAKSILRFAESVDADLLLANPDEIEISSLTKLDISDKLGRDSKLQLLTVEREVSSPS